MSSKENPLAYLFIGALIGAWLTIIAYEVIRTHNKASECATLGGQLIRLDGKDFCLDPSVIKVIK